MRLGVIDVGSNTVHLLVVDAHRGAQPLPATSHKIELRLSEHVTDSGDISEAGEVALTGFIDECLGVAEDQGVEDVLAFVTSAIREAPNGEDVLARVRAATGVALQVLSGEDEARLTFLAARRWFGWSSGTLLVVDIGGGSLELAAGMDEEPDAAVSLPLGAGRLTRDLLPGDPPGPDVVREARRVIRQRLAAAVRPLAKAGAADRAVGTSKTMRSLARVTGAAPSSEGPYAARSLERAALATLVTDLAGMSVRERAGLSGVSASRSPQLLAGALVAEAAMDLLDLERLEICPWALREGVILSRLDTMG
ncbi:exopolyphosphatase / guanosine-5'-triphosphate,3'-diphosphate pyrophosphatase [Pedococcus dokdonensis]|uniref:Exopolyphosphatase / guanosine-5'-triphosphate,3'-diphosphate pyrophosphatase n=1 Tax=Pedococcus dokdonensis TaxID=443156 RepID=A0A1H0UWM4_9MICO|nr:Ppx/GppA phosphatase family protein [Pedococcus dokdonensis]SDP70652.1 exopolyphosphatase / guanosine-5'-triphosphate,3'-diphosphate pyrophosphatase [Pedococcus dokdonensis]